MGGVKSFVTLEEIKPDPADAYKIWWPLNKSFKSVDFIRQPNEVCQVTLNPHHDRLDLDKIMECFEVCFQHSPQRAASVVTTRDGLLLSNWCHKPFLEGCRNWVLWWHVFSIQCALRTKQPYWSMPNRQTSCIPCLACLRIHLMHTLPYLIWFILWAGCWRLQQWGQNSHLQLHRVLRNIRSADRHTRDRIPRKVTADEDMASCW